MNQVDEIVFNKDEEKVNYAKISSFFIPEFISNEMEIIQTLNSNDQSKDKIFQIDNIKNIFDESCLTLNESDDEENEKSIYFLKKQDNFEIDSRISENSTNIFTDQEKYLKGKKEDSFKKKINFKTVLRKKRGKKAKDNENNSTKKPHGSDDFDNIQRKIQVHYISFLISFANDKLRNIFGNKCKYNFKDVKYDLKRIVNHKNVEYLKQSKYSDIIQMKISPKNKKFNEDTNKNIYLELIKISKEFENFFDKKYLYIFQKYYLGLKKNENEINFEGQKTLTVVRNGVTPETAKPEIWEGIITEFTQKIKENVGNEIISYLESDFTTTNPATLATSQMTIMSAMKNYFKYEAIMMVCGISSINLEGTLEDWEKIKKKLEFFSKNEFGLNWWTKHLIPIIDKIIETKICYNKNKDIDENLRKFWKDIIRVKRGGVYQPDVIDGWIVKFLPNISEERINEKLNDPDIPDQADCPPC